MQRFKSPGSAQKFLLPPFTTFSTSNAATPLPKRIAPRRRGDEHVAQRRRGPLTEMSRAAGFLHSPFDTMTMQTALRVEGEGCLYAAEIPPFMLMA